MVQTRSQTAKALVSQQRHETETTPIYEPVENSDGFNKKPSDNNKY